MATLFETVVVGLAVDRAQPDAASEMGYLIGQLIGRFFLFWIGIKALSAGMKRFRRSLPLSEKGNLSGKVVGVVYIVMGSYFMLATLLGLVTLAFVSPGLAVVFGVAAAVYLWHRWSTHVLRQRMREAMGAADALEP